MYTIKERGFTLIELLVVIAIIGILASVVLAGLGSQRDKAREANALQTARSMLPIATVCRDAGGTVLESTGVGHSGADSGGGDSCNPVESANDVWPNLPLNWVWGPVTNGDTDAWQFTAIGGGNFDDVADAGERLITCTISNCAVSTI